MANVCKICRLPAEKRREIEAQILAKVELRTIANQLGCSHNTVLRHRYDHILADVDLEHRALEATSKEAVAVAAFKVRTRGEQRMNKCDDQQFGSIANATLAANRQLGELGAVLEARGDALDAVAVRADYDRLLAVVLLAVEPFPEARAAILDALSGAEPHAPGPDRRVVPEIVPDRPTLQ